MNYLNPQYLIGEFCSNLFLKNSYKLSEENLNAAEDRPLALSFDTHPVGKVADFIDESVNMDDGSEGVLQAVKAVAPDERYLEIEKVGDYLIAKANDEKYHVKCPGENGKKGIIIEALDEGQVQSILNSQKNSSEGFLKIAMPGINGNKGIVIETNDPKVKSYYKKEDERTVEVQFLNELFHKEEPDSPRTHALRKELFAMTKKPSCETFSWEDVSKHELQKEMVARLKFTLLNNAQEAEKTKVKALLKKMFSFRNEAPMHKDWNTALVDALKEIEKDKAYSILLPDLSKKTAFDA